MASKPSRSRKPRSTVATDQFAALEQRIGDLTNTVQANSTAISELQKIPDAVAEIKALILQQNPNVSSAESNIPVDPDVMIDNDLFEFDERQNEADAESADDDLLSILNASQCEQEYGSPINKSLAESLTGLRLKKVTKESIEKLKASLKPPENCKLLGVPLVNPEIWNVLPVRYRQKDIQLQSIQSFVSMTSVKLAQMGDLIMSLANHIDHNLKQDIFQMVMDCATVNGIASQELSIRRKMEIRPGLNRDAATLCSLSNPVTEYLFGDNVSDQIKTARSASNLLKAPGPRFSRGNRPLPYVSNRNQRPFAGNAYRPSPVVPRGGHFRGSQRFATRRPPMNRTFLPNEKNQ